MTTKTTIALTCALMFAATVAFAHHAPGSLGTVRITEAVMAGGTTLQPGTYEMRDTGEHLSPLPGQSPDAMVWVEFVAGGKVVARDGAEIMTSDRPVGTSGGSSTSRPRVDRLKDHEFVRISTYRDGSRYLIHLRPAQK